MLSADQVGMLRAVISGDVEGWVAYGSAVEAAGGRGIQGLGVLWSSAFTEACSRLFGDLAVSEVVRYVANVRNRRGKDADPIDPVAAEYVIRSALGGDRVDGDLAGQETSTAQVLLLPEVLIDLALDQQGREDILVAAKNRAERWLTNQRAISDGQIEALRAFLAVDLAAHGRLMDSLDPTEDGPRYATLIGAAFSRAVQRRFSGDSELSEIINFVARVRSQAPEIANSLDPSLAERMILKVITHEQESDIDEEQTLDTETVLLGALIIEENLNAQGIEDFLVDVRALANKRLSNA